MAYFTASCDEPDFNKEFAEELGLDYPILSDPKREVAKAYGVLNPANNLPFRHTIYISKDGKILFVDKEVKAKEHGDSIVKKLQELKVEPAEEEPEKKSEK